MIEFRLDERSGVPPYRQLVQQVKDALRLGLLRAGDQLPTVKEVVATIAINPNTVQKAYRDLEYQGLVGARPGLGTFVLDNLPLQAAADHRPLARSLSRWIKTARAAGLDEEDILALVTATLRGSFSEEEIA